MAGKRKNPKVITYRGFLHLPNALTEHPNFLALSGSALRLLIDIGRQFNGGNNGDLCACRSMLIHQGWKSNNKLTRAKRELLASGLITKTKRGGLGLGPDLFALAWQPIHPCGGKLDIEPTNEPILKLREVMKCKS